MKFRTEIKASKSETEVSHKNQILCIGSCFAEHIGGKLERLKFPAHVNPFGIVYNPISVAQTLERVLSGESFSKTELFENQGLFHSFPTTAVFQNLTFPTL